MSQRPHGTIIFLAVTTKQKTKKKKKISNASRLRREQHEFHNRYLMRGTEVGTACNAEIWNMDRVIETVPGDYAHHVPREIR